MLLPFFTTECAVAAHSQPTLSVLEMRRFILLVTLSFACFVYGQSVDSRKVLINRLVELLRYETQHSMFAETCMTGGGTPEAVLAENPNYFGGIRSGDHRWSAVTVAYQTYMKEACAHPTKQEFLGAIAKSYSASLSDAQLKAAITFYETPGGRALSEANLAAVRAVYDELSRAREEQLPASSVRFQAELMRLLKEK